MKHVKTYLRGTSVTAEFSLTVLSLTLLVLEVEVSFSVSDGTWLRTIYIKGNYIISLGPML